MRAGNGIAEDQLSYDDLRDSHQLTGHAAFKEWALKIKGPARHSPPEKK